MLRLHDTAAGRVRELARRRPGEVSMYVCGPTVYGLPHLGHGRFALSFDVLRRYLEFRGNTVVHVSNVTDLDDKIIQRADAEDRTIDQVSAEFEAAWWSAMDALGCLRPTHTPHATAYVEAMVDCICKLESAGAAYETPDGMYLDVSVVPDYGMLAHQSPEDMRAGARVEIDNAKRSPMDFALWKKAKPGEPVWPSPWGQGRPGWHTECVVMSLHLLGDGFDLHGGAQDLIFPHHENERAQAVALGRDFAHHWVHNGWVTVEGEKMSKSLGNYTTLPELLAHHDARAYRMLVLGAHYRSPIEVTPATLTHAEGALARLDAMARRFGVREAVMPPGEGVGALAAKRFVACMDTDLDSPGALAALFEMVSAAHLAADHGNTETARGLAARVVHLAGALGLVIDGGTAPGPGDAAQELAAARDAARTRRDWAEADRIRALLQEDGWLVEDTPSGTVLTRAPGEAQGG